MNLRQKFLHLLLSFSFVGIFIPSSHAQSVWTEKQSLPANAIARDGAVSFSIGNTAYLGTGHYTSTHYDSTAAANVAVEESLSDFWAYNGSAWTQVASISTARDQAFGFAISTKGYVGGGHSLDNVGVHHELKDLWEYNPTANTWTQKADMPITVAGKAEAIGFSIGAKGYAGLGYYHDNANPQNVVETRDFWEYNPSNNTWLQKANFTGNRYGAVGVSNSNKGFVGLGMSGTTYYNDWWQFDPATGAWTAKAAFSGTARKGAVGMGFCSKVFVGTGMTGAGATNTCYEYAPSTNTWAATTNFSGGMSHEGTAFLLNESVYLATGNVNGTASKGLWQYTSAANCCSLVMPAGADQTICAGASVTIGGAAVAGFTYAWTPITKLSSATISNPLASPTATTSYILTVTGSGCTKKDTVKITVNPLPVANAGADKTKTASAAAVQIGVAAVAGCTYVWTPTTGLSSATISNPMANPAATTTYTVTVTNAKGCTKKDDVIVTVTK